jgi:hypothetical protein
MKSLMVDIALGVVLFLAIVTVVLFAASKSGGFIYAAF